MKLSEVIEQIDKRPGWKKRFNQQIPLFIEAVSKHDRFSEWDSNILELFFKNSQHAVSNATNKGQLEKHESNRYQNIYKVGIKLPVKSS